MEDEREERRAHRLRMRRGDSPTFYFQLLANPLTGERRAVLPGERLPDGFSAFNLAGAFVWFTATQHFADPDQQATLQVTSQPSSVPAGGAVVFVNAAAGQIACTLPTLGTRGLPDGVVALVFDVQVQEGSGAISTFDTGVLEVSPDVTKAIAAPVPPPPPPPPATATWTGFTVATLAALQNLPDVGLTDGTPCYVAALFRYYSLQRGNTDAVDGVHVLLPPSGSGRWTDKWVAQAPYAPASLPNWSGVAPTSIGNALDRIAAKIGPIP